MTCRCYVSDYVDCGSIFFFFSSRRRHTRFDCDWSSDVCSSDLTDIDGCGRFGRSGAADHGLDFPETRLARTVTSDRKSTRLNSSHSQISYAVFCLKKKKKSTFTYNPQIRTHTYNTGQRARSPLT